MPLINIGPVNASGANLNVIQSYIIEFDGNGQSSYLQKVGGGSVFYKPVDNIGEKSIPDYAAYAANFIADVLIPGCAIPGPVFVGQRKEGFVINVGEIFDLMITNPVGPRDWSQHF